MPWLMYVKINLAEVLANATFTQYYCNGTNALGDCMNDIKKCHASTNEQGACLHTQSGGSLVGHCDTGGYQIIYEIYPDSPSCQGTPQKAVQPTDICQQGGGGEYFVKLECTK